MSHRLSFKVASDQDLPVLTPLIEAYHGFDGHVFDQAQIEQAVLGLIDEPQLGRIWLISLDNEVIGYIVLCFGYSLEFLGRDAFVDEFFIKEEFRNQGIGKQALAYVTTQAKVLGIKAIHLEVNRKNDLAMSVYRSLGFTARDKYVFMSVDIQ